MESFTAADNMARLTDALADILGNILDIKFVMNGNYVAYLKWHIEWKNNRPPRTNQQHKYHTTETERADNDFISTQ